MSPRCEKCKSDNVRADMISLAVYRDTYKERNSTGSAPRQVYKTYNESLFLCRLPSPTCSIQILHTPTAGETNEHVKA